MDTRLLKAAARYLELRRQKSLSRGRHLRAVGRTLWRAGRSRPLLATVAVTGRCPLDCEHCSAGGPKDAEPERALLDQTLDALIRLGTPVVALTGGEPLMRADLIELVDRLPAALVFTSGVGPERRIRALAARPDVTACVSLDHTDPDEHDRRRGRAGAHAAARRALELLVAGAGETHVSTLVTADRIDSGELRRFLRTFDGVACVQLFRPVRIGRLVDVESPTAESLRRLAGIVAEANADPSLPLVVAYSLLEREDALGCCAGYARLHVDALGDVRPCDFAPRVFGNVQVEPLDAIWRRMHRAYPTPGHRCLAGGDGPRHAPGAYRAHSRLAYDTMVQSLSFASVVLEGRPCAG